MNEHTPREIVAELDKYIIGQAEAKKAVAIALRNRWRSRQLDETMRDDIIPKNILMIGSTGVGKTEIARRLAKLVDAPFVKVEATKFTEVGYVGRDVDSIVRELAEASVRMVKKQRLAAVAEQADAAAEERIVDAFVPESKTAAITNPLQRFFSDDDEKTEAAETSEPKYKAGRAFVKKRLAAGELEDELIEINVETNGAPMIGMIAGQGMDSLESSLQDMLGKFMPKKNKTRKVPVKQARKIFRQEEADKLVDMDAVIEEAVALAETTGIVFIDEIDKVAGHNGHSGPDVSREGVQRDILPIVEGSTVVTKYGPVKTDHILFIAAGAFHVSKPSDLIPELQGRFPIRVELNSLTQKEFCRILTEPRNALTKQYTALLATEGIELTFTADAIEKIAALAEDVNTQTENIGARRLHTILEKLLEDLSFDAPDLMEKQVEINAAYVAEKLHEISEDTDLTRFIL